MRIAAALCLALLASLPARAQIFRPEAVNGAVLGGLAGAIIGHNSGGHNGARGAAIGAGAGLLIGSIAGEANDSRYATRVSVGTYPRTYLYRRGSRFYGRPGFSYYYGAPAYYSENAYYGADDFYSDYDRPNYATNGLLLGALAGAVIGHNSGGLRHNAWRGAALGATTGFIFGSIAESNARRREAILTRRSIAGQTADYAVSAPLSTEPPAVAPATPLAAASPMSAANALFGRR